MQVCFAGSYYVVMKNLILVDLELL